MAVPSQTRRGCRVVMPFPRGSSRIPRGGILDHMVETLTAIAAVIGAVGSVTAGIGVLVVNGKIDRLTGRVDALESTMQTVLTLIAGRPGPAPAQPSGD